MRLAGPFVRPPEGGINLPKDWRADVTLKLCRLRVLDHYRTSGTSFFWLTGYGFWNTTVSLQDFGDKLLLAWAGSGLNLGSRTSRLGWLGLEG